jgi:hypothetical protein
MRLNLSQLCVQKHCHQLDCIDYQLVSELAEYARSGLNDSKLILDASSGLDTIIISQPVYEYITFITDIAGIVSFWSGMCPISLLLADAVINWLSAATRSTLMQKIFIFNLYSFMAVVYFVQIQGVVQEYFSYPTSNQLIFHPEIDNTEAPVVSICFETNFQGYVDLEWLSQHQSQNMSFFEKSSGYRLNDSYAFYGHICFSFSKNKDQENNTALKRREKNNITILFQDVFNKIKPCKRVRITMRSDTIHLFDAGNNIYQLQSIDPKLVMTSYSCILHQGKLEQPYETDCIDKRNRHGMKSASHCLNTCYNDRFYKKYSNLPFNSPVPLSLFRKYNVKSWNNSDNMDSELLRGCKRECKSDCSQIYYFLSPLIAHLPSKEWKLTLQEQKSRRISVKYSAKLPLLGLIYVVLNGASFWLAFSPIMVMNLIEWCYESFINTHNKPEECAIGTTANEADANPRDQKGANQEEGLTDVTSFIQCDTTVNDTTSHSCDCNDEPTQPHISKWHFIRKYLTEIILELKFNEIQTSCET